MLSNLEIRKVVEELKRSEGSYFQKFARLKNGYKIKFQNTEVVVFPPERIHSTKYSYDAETPKSAELGIRKRLKGSKLKEVRQENFDRVIVFEFDNDYSLVVELFAKGNVVLVDPEGNTFQAMKYDSWKDRKIRPKKHYSFPKNTTLNPETMTEEEFESIFTGKDVIRSMVKNINMSGEYLEEACFRAKIDKNAVKCDYKALFNTIKRMVGEKIKAGVQDKPRPFKLLSVNAPFKEMPSFNEALDDFYSPEVKVEHKKSSELEHRLEEQESSVKRFEEDIEDNTRKGDWVYEKYADLDKLVNSINSLKEKGLSWAEIKEKMPKNVRIDEKKQKIVIETK